MTGLIEWIGPCEWILWADVADDEEFVMIEALDSFFDVVLVLIADMM